MWNFWDQLSNFFSDLQNVYKYIHVSSESKISGVPVKYSPCIFIPFDWSSLQVNDVDQDHAVCGRNICPHDRSRSILSPGVHVSPSPEDDHAHQKPEKDQERPGRSGPAIF